MSSDVYELVALTARYVFAGMMLLIVLRAARGALVDSRRATKLRKLSPMTGLVGEMVVLQGDQRAKKGMHYPVIREGTIGSSRRADIRVRNTSVRRKHAYFQLASDGLHVRSHAGARIRDKKGNLQREMTMLDGDVIQLGNIKLLLVLSAPEAGMAQQTLRSREEAEADRRNLNDEDDDYWADVPDEDDREAASDSDYSRESAVYGREASEDPDQIYRRPVQSLFDDEPDRTRDSADDDPDAIYRRPKKKSSENSERRSSSRERGYADDDPDAVYRRPKKKSSEDSERRFSSRERNYEDDDPDQIYRRPKKKSSEDSERRSSARERGYADDDPDQIYRRPEKKSSENSERRSSARERGYTDDDPDQIYRRPTKRTDEDDYSESSDDRHGKNDASRAHSAKKSASKNNFPPEDDPFDIFLDDQDDDFDF